MIECEKKQIIEDLKRMMRKDVNYTGDKVYNLAINDAIAHIESIETENEEHE